MWELGTIICIDIVANLHVNVHTERAMEVAPSGTPILPPEVLSAGLHKWTYHDQVEILTETLRNKK